MRTAYDIVLRPIITEQSMEDMDIKKYVFEVAKDANKAEIAAAIEKIFDVTVIKVTTNTSAARKAPRQQPGRPDQKLEKGSCQAERRLQEHRIFENMAIRGRKKCRSKHTDLPLPPVAR
jgi:large subunit ribosomal protein L23